MKIELEDTEIVVPILAVCLAAVLIVLIVFIYKYNVEDMHKKYPVNIEDTSRK